MTKWSEAGAAASRQTNRQDWGAVHAVTRKTVGSSNLPPEKEDQVTVLDAVDYHRNIVGEIETLLTHAGEVNRWLRDII